MSIVLTTVLPFFAIIFCGMLAGRRELLTGEAVRALNTFVFYFALPALVALKLAQTPLSALFHPGFFFAWLCAALLTYLSCALLGRVMFRTSAGESAVQGLGCCFSNTGFLGFPMLVALYGDWVAGPFVIALTIDMVVLIPLATVWLQAMSPERSGSIATRITQAWRDSLLTPLIAAILVGLAIPASGLNLAAPIERFLDTLGQAAAPSALFALGVALASRNADERRGELAFLTVGKLAIHPGNVALFVTLFAVDDAWAKVGVLFAALPIANTVFVLADEFDTYAVRTSAAILVTTLVSILSLSALVYWLG